jgi:hypothetical protein
MTTRTTSSGRKHRNGASPPSALLKLDLGCGQNKAEGFLGVDFVAAEGVDIVVDLSRTPWPWDDASVEEVHCSHFLEHLTGEERIGFANELYRVLVPGGKATIITPWWGSVRAIQDPTHKWPPVADNSYLYWNRGWREINKLDHYPFTCDFDFAPAYVMAVETGVHMRPEETRAFWLKHYVNMINDLQVVLTKRE